MTAAAVGGGARDSLVARLARVVELQPDKLFVHFLAGSGDNTLTYGQLWSESSAYAAHYRGRGLARGDVLVLMLPPGPNNYPAFVGAIREGIVPSFMPLPGAKQPPEVYWPIHGEVLRRHGIRAVLTSQEQAAEIQKHLPDLEISVLTVDAVEDADPSTVASREPAIRRDDLAFIQHSSGTTGVKKGVRLTHGIVLAQIDAYAELLGFDEEACVVSWLPLYHDMGLITSFLMPMAKGASIVAMSPFDWLIDPTAWLEAAVRYRCTHAWMPNFAFAHLACVVSADPAWDLSRMRWINCSEPCKAGSFKQFQESFACAGVNRDAFGVCYAMAENVFAVTQTRSDVPPRALRDCSGTVVDPERRLEDSATMGMMDVLSCGYPLPGVEIRIWDAAGRPLPDGETGEIAIRGPYLFNEYHDDPDTTARRFRHGWFLTHDLGLMQDGELFVTGRVDDLINLYGRKVYAHDVESSVMGVPGVLPGRCVAIGHGSRTAASQELIVLAETAPDLETAALKRAIKIKVEAEVGVTVGKVELFSKGWLIKTTSGKISRYLNHRKFMDMQAAS